MIDTSFNMFDAIVLGIIGLSALFSFLRGFVREFLSLGAWFGALLITLYFFPTAAALLKPHVKSTMIAAGFAAVGVFMISLIVISIFTSMLMRLLKSGSDIGLLDNALGLIFGAARGALVVALAYLGYSAAVPEDQYPDYVKTSVTKPYVEKAAIFVAQIAPDYLSDITPLKEKPLDDVKLDLKDHSLDDDEPIAAKSPKPADEKSKGYQWDSMDKLQKMIDQKANEGSK